MTDWSEYAKHKDLRSVIDSGDTLGFKNEYINLLHHKILSDNMENLHGKRVLDLGCGIGRFTEFLQSRGAEVTGVDFCEDMLSLYTGCEKVCTSVNKLPFEDKSFDVILSVWTLQHLTIKLLIETVKELDRILVTGGTVYIIEQVSEDGYDEIASRYVSDYVNAFENFIFIKSRPIVRERDIIVGIIRKGFVPEILFPLISNLHLDITKCLNSDSLFGYTDCFMVFKKGDKND